MTDVDWTKALCLGCERELWFVEGNDSTANADRRAAKQTCLICPIRSGCLDSAMAEESGRGESGRYGIRGALSGKQRYALSQRLPGAQPKQQRAA
ncbi:WhiB family transcriptional regulator [Streptomyces sp. BE230]|uniref:WhiB family transcriptional regulator n=1 Tax=Streptomyces sp. BE230 TaxID=3002526 RepID=UPI002ED5CFAD|nr:WhiB family transcriptional regulator [Streptomyces sp. BE230]